MVPSPRFLLGVSAVGRYNEEDGGTDDRVLFANATNATEDLSNAFALDMTYRVLYYGQRNTVRAC